MQSPHHYPRTIWQPPIRWFARPNASVDLEPLPVRPTARARAMKIRRAFLHDCQGRATVATVLEVCRQKGLLTGLEPASAAEIVKRCLRPLAQHK